MRRFFPGILSLFEKKIIMSINEIDENNLTNLTIITYYRSLTKCGKFIQLAWLSCAKLVSARRSN